MKLSEGSLSAIMRGENIEDPILQILGNKKIVSAGANERYRLLVSDGCHLNSFAMLATQLNSRLATGELSDYSVVKIDRFITSLVNSEKGNKRVMIILELTVLAPGSEIGVKLGNPVPLVEGANDQSKPEPPRSTASTNDSVSSVSSVSRPAPVRNVAAASPIDTMHTYPISSLNPYQNRWVIRARVTNKSAIRTWSNARGEGKLFSMDLVDESGEIRATAFREQVDKYYDLIEVNNVYFISRCTLKTANKKFTSIKHDYEITFNSDTQVIPCHDDSSDIPALQFDFTPLEKIGNMEANTNVDVIGVCKSANDLQTLINVTLWGSEAENFDVSKNPVIAVKGGRINEFGGSKSVSIAMSSVVQMNPDIPEAHRLRGWYDAGGSEENVKNISATAGGITRGGQWMTLQEARAKQLGTGDKAEYFTCKATIMLIKSENSIYKACPTASCNKKVTDLQNGSYRCEKCCQEFQDYKYRLLVQATLADWSGKQWVSAFQESAEVMLGTTADALGALTDLPEEFVEPFTRAAFKSFIFRLRVKMEMYNDESRMKTVIVSVSPINYKEYTSYLINKIKKQAGMSTDRHFLVGQLLQELKYIREKTRIFVYHIFISCLCIPLHILNQ
ncbi:Replication protein A subunit [Gryllus bimaculatus]|nr:Replication protein A subunit [Gryllus bimaculatus]